MTVRSPGQVQWPAACSQLASRFKVSSVQFNSVTQSCLTLCDPLDCKEIIQPFNLKKKKINSEYALEELRLKLQYLTT